MFNHYFSQDEGKFDIKKTSVFQRLLEMKNIMHDDRDDD